MNLPALPPTIKINEACTRYGTSRNTILRRLKEGKMLFYKPGQEILIDLDSADSWFRTSGNMGTKRRIK